MSCASRSCRLHLSPAQATVSERGGSGQHLGQPRPHLLLPFIPRPVPTMSGRQHSLRICSEA